jgi:CubicO group peptidase (beta-lactamase class C family)
VADKCDPIRSKLHALEGQLAKIHRFLPPEPGEKNPPKPRPNPDWTNLASQIASTRLALRTCVESLRRFTVTGNGFVGSIELDAVISTFMKAHDIRAMSVAVAHDGTLSGNRGYTWAQPNYPITQPHTLFRVASISKIFTCAAIDRLVTTGALTFTTQAFGHLGITSSLLPTQTPDAEIDQITVLELANRTSGLQRDFGVDFRTIASRLGQSVMPTRAQLVAYLYGEPLFARPGTVDHYSNSAFTMLTSVVEKAAGRSFIDYLRQDLLQPLHLDDVRVGATAANGRIPNEVSTYDDAGFGPSQVDMDADATAPNAYGGQFTLENGEGAGGLIMSTGTVARFLAKHAVWNIGPRESGARYGDFAGTGAAAVSRPDGLDFAYAFNHLVDNAHHDALVSQINAILDRHTRVKAGGGLGSIGAFVGTLAGTIRRWIARRLEH